MLRLFRAEDTLIAGLLCMFCLATGLVNPEFFSIGTVFDMLRSAVVVGMFAVGVLVVLISGGIDVSFTAIAALAMYASIKIVMVLGLGDHVAYVFLIATLLGLALGLINGLFIGTLKLPTLIVTLGTLSVFRGFLLTVVGTKLIPTLPAGMRSLARSKLVTVQAADGSIYSLPAVFLCLAVAVILAWLLLSRSTLGRSVFAVGGSVVSAERVGIRVPAIQYFVYGTVGALAGATGVVHATLTRAANPFDLVGLELSVIAAVVLGGARISGGYGSLLGTMLGVALVSVMNNSLIMWGIPSSWQNVVLGLLILIGTGIPAIRDQRRTVAA